MLRVVQKRDGFIKYQRWVRAECILYQLDIPFPSPPHISKASNSPNLPRGLHKTVQTPGMCGPIFTRNKIRFLMLHCNTLHAMFTKIYINNVSTINAI